MKCPYCEKELIPGFIYGDRYSLKWLPESKKLLGGIWAISGEAISTGGGRPKVKCYRCTDCNKMIIDLDER